MRMRLALHQALLLFIGLASLALAWPAKKYLAALAVDPFLWLAGIQACLCAAGAAFVWNGRSSRTAFWVVFGIGILLRLATVWEEPRISDDIHRYVWDGRVQAAGINPYRYIPAAPELAFLRDDRVYPKINRRDYAPTIYPPGAQMFFFAVTRVSESLVWFKTVLLALEALTIWLLARLLMSFHLPRERVLIYSWNPLVFWEFSSGHIDFLMTALLLLALCARRARRDTLTGILLGCAALVKFFPLVLLPALYRRWDWKMPLALLATVCLGYLPYVAVGGRVFGFLSGYAGEEGMGSGRFFLLLLARCVTGGREIPTALYVVICLAILAVMAVLAVPRWNDGARGFIFSAGCIGTTVMVFVSPQFPWYWVWLTPLLAFLPLWALFPLFYAGCGALLRYGRWFEDGRWFGLGIDAHLALGILQFAPAALLALAIYFLHRRRSGRAALTDGSKPPDVLAARGPGH